MQNRTSEPYITPVFPPLCMLLPSLLFAVLRVVLTTAVLSMLIKGFILELDHRHQGLTDLKKRAVIKELREQGLLRWRPPELITILPSLIRLSVIVFVIALTIYLFYVHKLHVPCAKKNAPEQEGRPPRLAMGVSPFLTKGI